MAMIMKTVILTFHFAVTQSKKNAKHLPVITPK